MPELDDQKGRSIIENRFRRPVSVRGPRLHFRNVNPSDAEFILSLRLDSDKNKYLSYTSANIHDQQEWLARMQDDQLYFIIETDRPVGTVRLYDQRGTSFCWGSWILSNDAPQSSAVESTLMVYYIGMELGFDSSHFDVRKGNEKVWRYHERMGAKRVGETDDDYLYSIDKLSINRIFDKYINRIGSGIEIIW